MSTVDPNTDVAWWNAWGKLKQIIAQLDMSVARLNNARNYALTTPNLRAEYLAKMDTIKSMKNKAEWLRDNIKAAMNYFGVELSGVPETVASGLGFIPLLVWPLVAGGVAWLGSKTLDLFQFSQRVDEQQRLENNGMTPEAAAALVKQNVESGSISGSITTLGTIAIIAAVGFGLWYVMRGRK